MASVCTTPWAIPVRRGSAFCPAVESRSFQSADAIGLARLGSGVRRALDSTSFGVGELIRAALDRGVATILVALGGSATNDGTGIGAAQALGAVLTGIADARTLPRPARSRHPRFVSPGRAPRARRAALCYV